MTVRRRTAAMAPDLITFDAMMKRAERQPDLVSEGRVVLCG